MSYSNRCRALHFMAGSGNQKGGRSAVAGGAAVWRPVVRRRALTGGCETVPCGGRTVTVNEYGKGRIEGHQEGLSQH